MSSSSGIKNIFLNEIQKGCIIRHPNKTVKDKSLFRYDGVHLSDVSNNTYLNNIQGASAIWACLYMFIPKIMHE
jgi:hypothetical protein